MIPSITERADSILENNSISTTKAQLKEEGGMVLTRYKPEQSVIASKTALLLASSFAVMDDYSEWTIQYPHLPINIWNVRIAKRSPSPGTKIQSRVYLGKDNLNLMKRNITI